MTPAAMRILPFQGCCIAAFWFFCNLARVHGHAPLCMLSMARGMQIDFSIQSPLSSNGFGKG